MTLHTVTRGTQVPPWWTYRQRHRLGAQHYVTAELMTIGHQEILDEVQRLLSRELRAAALEYGYEGTLHMQTRTQRSDITDPLAPVETVGMTADLNPHIWFSSDCMNDMQPVAIVEGAILPHADQRRGSDCRCALCVYTNLGTPEGGPDGSDGWRRVGEKHGWLPRSEPGEETPLWDGSDEPVSTAAGTFEFAPDEEDDETEEEVCCHWCGDALTDNNIFTRVDTGTQYHLGCAMEAADEQ